MPVVINYCFRASAADSDQHARRLVECLRAKCIQSGFIGVSPIVEVIGDVATAPGAGLAHSLIAAAAQRQVPYRQPSGATARIIVRPIHAIAFTASPGKGCTPSIFGLCRYPLFAEEQFGIITLRLPTHLGGVWSWRNRCQTDRAADPIHGGMLHFIDSHTRLVHLLDYAAELKMLQRAGDTSGYWRQRDSSILAAAVSFAPGDNSAPAVPSRPASPRAAAPAATAPAKNGDGASAPQLPRPAAPAPAAAPPNGLPRPAERVQLRPPSPRIDHANGNANANFGNPNGNGHAHDPSPPNFRPVQRPAVPPPIPAPRPAPGSGYR